MMTRILYILAILMISCSSTKKISSSIKWITPPIVEFDKNLDTILTCYVYQYAGLDSISKSISKIVKYDSKNRILSEQYQGFKESSYDGTANVIDFYDYKNELLIQERTVYTDNSTPSFRQLDSAKTVFYYDNLNKLVKRQHYDFKRRLKPDVDKGLGRPGGCIIEEEDYEKESTWDITSEIFFKYDSLDRKTEYYAPKIHWGNQNRYTWSYYDNGKINEYRSYDHDRLIWIEKFSYTDTSYQFIRTWYDYEGNPEHLKEKSWEYTPQITLISRLDNKGRVIEETKVNEKGEYLNSTITEYNKLGYVVKEVRYNKDKQPEMTHIYEYKQ
jgi:hypothetical protein